MRWVFEDVESLFAICISGVEFGYNEVRRKLLAMEICFGKDLLTL
jgi:hypothetical protein